MKGNKDYREAKERRPLNRALRRFVLVFIPILATLIFVLILFLALDNEVFNIMVGAVIGYSFTPFGPEIFIPMGIGFLFEAGASHLTFLLIFSVVFVDVVLALFILLNFEAVETVPKLGYWIRKSEEIFSRKLKKGKETLALSALALYVALPFQGSGGFIGSIMGRVVGLNKYKVFFTVILGSVMGALPIGLAAYYGMAAVINALQAGEDIYRVIGVLIIIIFIILLVYVIRREKMKSRTEKEKEDGMPENAEREDDQ